MKTLLALLFFFQAAAPKLTDTQRAQFFKAQSEANSAQAFLQQAQQQAQAKQAALNVAVDMLKKACGSGFDIKLSDDNEPVCVATPKAAGK